MPAPQKSPSRPNAASDMMVRGVILALIGLILLIAPHFMSPTPLRDLFLQAQILAWFALVLGLAFMGRDGLRLLRGRRG